MFTDSSTDEIFDIQEYNWVIGNEEFTTQNPTYLFSTPGFYPVQLTVKSDTGCENTTSKIITIDSLPEANFTYSSACIGDSVTFSSNSSVNSDMIVNYQWNFLGIGIKEGKEVKVLYNQVSDESAQLTVTTQKGCKASKTSTIYVNDKPTANFSVNTTFGAIPLEIKTTNLSSTSQKFYWTFDENTNSSEISPTHVYTELGNYTVQLVAESTLGCKDTLRKEIEVVDLYIDVILHSINVLENEKGQWEIILDVENKSTFTLDSTAIEISLGGDITLFETMPAFAPEERQKFYTLGFTLTKEKAQKLDFICAELIPSIKNVKENNLLDNEKCISLQSDFEINNAYPNPTQDDVTIEYFLPTEGLVTVTLYNSIGDLFFTTNSTKSEGTHTQIIDLSTLPDGLYMAVLKFNGKEIVYKIIRD